MVQIRCENSASYKQWKKCGKINREASFVWPFSLIQCTKMRKYLKEYKKSVKNTFGKSWETAEKELGPWHGGAVWLTSDRWTAVWGGQGSEMRNGDEGALYLFYWSLMTSWRSRWRLRQKEHFHVYGSDCGTTNVKLFTKMPWVLSFGNWKQLKYVFSFHNSSLKN